MSKGMNLQRVNNTINYLLDNNNKRQEEGKWTFAVNLVGESGIGKTSIVRQIAEKRGMTLVKLNLAQLDEVGDLLGFPVKEVEAQMFKIVEENGVKKRVVANKIWTTKEALETIDPKGVKHMLTNRTRMNYAKPAWVPEYNENGTILLLDDYTRCTPVFAQAIMDLMLEQGFISWHLPKKTTIVLTSNPDNGVYNVTNLDPAQTGRCFNYNVEFSEDEWAKWAERYGIDSRCINFMLFYGNELTKRDSQGNCIADPRSYTMFCETIGGLKDWEDEDTLSFIQDIAMGCFNDDKGSFGSMFATFLSMKMHLLLSPKELLLDKWEIVGPKLQEQLNKDGQRNISLAAIMERRFTNYVEAWLDSDEKTPIATLRDRLLDIVHSDAFSQDLVYHMIKTITKGHKAQTGKLMYEPDIKKYILE